MTTPEDLARELEALLPSVHIFISDGQYRYAAEKLASALQAQPAPQGDVVEAVARAIWAVQRNDLDKCDMELADVGNYYETYDIARAAMSVLASLPSAEAGVEPVAYLWTHPSERTQLTHDIDLLDGFNDWTRVPLYAAPPTEATPVVLRAKEIAASALQTACETDPADPEHPDTVMLTTGDFETIVRLAIENSCEGNPTEAAIRADEREACAKVADDYRTMHAQKVASTDGDDDQAADACWRASQIAAAIRSRGEG